MCISTIIGKRSTSKLLPLTAMGDSYGLVFIFVLESAGPRMLVLLENFDLEQVDRDVGAITKLAVQTTLESGIALSRFWLIVSRPKLKEIRDSQLECCRNTLVNRY